jgi:ABC-type transporter Mla MlaB component
VPAPLSWQIHTQRGEHTVVVFGEPDRPSVTALAAVVDRHLARDPGSLTLDLSGLSRGDDAAPTAWALLSGRIGVMSGTTLRLCGPDIDDALGSTNSGGCGGTLRSKLTRAAEATSAGSLSSPGFGDQILPVSGGARHGRNVATDACLAWNLPHAIGTTTLVASELVSHTAAYSSTMMTLTVLRHQDLCYVSVGGGRASGPPFAERGTAAHFGFRIINALADHWGCLPHDGGNLVWAALPAGPRVRPHVLV